MNVCVCVSTSRLCTDSVLHSAAVLVGLFNHAYLGLFFEDGGGGKLEGALFGTLARLWKCGEVGGGGGGGGAPFSIYGWEGVVPRCVFAPGM